MVESLPLYELNSEAYDALAFNLNPPNRGRDVETLALKMGFNTIFLESLKLEGNPTKSLLLEIATTKQFTIGTLTTYLNSMGNTAAVQGLLEAMAKKESSSRLKSMSSLPISKSVLQQQCYDILSAYLKSIPYIEFVRTSQMCRKWPADFPNQQRGKKRLHSSLHLPPYSLEYEAFNIETFYGQFASWISESVIRSAIAVELHTLWHNYIKRYTYEPELNEVMYNTLSFLKHALVGRFFETPYTVCHSLTKNNAQCVEGLQAGQELEASKTHHIWVNKTVFDYAWMNPNPSFDTVRGIALWLHQNSEERGIHVREAAHAWAQSQHHIIHIFDFDSC